MRDGEKEAIMRRVSLLSGLFFLAAPLTVWAADIAAESKISAVTVYPDFALVTRSASL